MEDEGVRRGVVAEEKRGGGEPWCWGSREEHASLRQLRGARQLEAKNKPQR